MVAPLASCLPLPSPFHTPCTFPAFKLRFLNHRGRDGRFPQKIADQVVLADVMREVVDTWTMGRRQRWRQGIEVGAPKHVRLPDCAGCDGDRGDGGVEFGVRSAEEKGFEGGAGG